ncbi:MAG: ArsR/SmtB family transcription factor [Arenicellales bacterium]|jgi:ArsR family transcriptional regulator
MALQQKKLPDSAESIISAEQMFLASETDLYVASRSLKAMGHPLRLKILCILAGGNEISVQDLVDLVGTSQSNISQHLSILRDKGILGSRKDANKVFYRIGDEKILALMETMREAFCSAHD